MLGKVNVKCSWLNTALPVQITSDSLLVSLSCSETFIAAASKIVQKLQSTLNG